MAQTLTARLPHPPSINRTYKVGQGRFYKDPLAVGWQQDALLYLRAAGFRTLPKGDYALRLALDLHTRGHDLDAVIKLTIDAIAVALAVNDRYVMGLAVEKTVVSRIAPEFLDVTVTVLEEPNQWPVSPFSGMDTP